MIETRTSTCERTGNRPLIILIGVPELQRLRDQATIIHRIDPMSASFQVDGLGRRDVQAITEIIDDLVSDLENGHTVELCPKQVDNHRCETTSVTTTQQKTTSLSRRATRYLLNTLFPCDDNNKQTERNRGNSKKALDNGKTVSFQYSAIPKPKVPN